MPNIRNWKERKPNKSGRIAVTVSIRKHLLLEFEKTNGYGSLSGLLEEKLKEVIVSYRILYGKMRQSGRGV